MTEKTIKLTTAQALVKFLANQYIQIDGKSYPFIRGIFGIFGHGQVCGVGQALEQNPENLKYYRIQNEQAGVHTAIGAAKHLNRLGCFAVTSSIGPGATNMITGAACATANRIPVLLLPGDIFADRQPDPVLQQIEQPYNLNIVANDAFKPVCKFWDRISRPEQLLTSLINAMRVLTDPAETGAVCIALPQDVQTEAFDFPVSFFKKRIHRIDRRPLSTEAKKIAIDLLHSKKRPLIIAGGGIHYSLAYDALDQFVKNTGIPVAFTQAGKSALRWDHPQNMGGMGVTGTKAANILAKEADLIIAIGTRLMDFTTVSKGAFLNPDVEIIGVNVSNFDAYKMEATPILADAKEALLSLNDALKKYSTSQEYQKHIQTLKEEWDSEVDRVTSIKLDKDSKFLPQPTVIGILNEHMDDKDVVVNAAGSMPGDLHRIWRSKSPKSYHVEYAYSTMGYEIAAGLGIKYVDPEAEVYVIQGDGGYLMMHTEIVTSLMEKTKIIILLFDSQGFNSISNLQQSMGSDGLGCDLRDRNQQTGISDRQGPIRPIDYAKNAESYGAISYSVQTLKEFKEALEKAKKADRTVLIDIKIQRWSQVGGYDSWWRVGVSETSTMDKVKEAHKEMKKNMKTAREY
ncbi:MAG: 3D-(3,5/4)-trihydroxycyclohexane-1,2-dione acylhydrolase (decyclizing) [Promethearchaeota archaeon]